MTLSGVVLKFSPSSPTKHPLSRWVYFVLLRIKPGQGRKVAGSGGEEGKNERSEEWVCSGKCTRKTGS